MLYEYEFTYTDFVSEPGEFSIRGGIVDIFSYSNDYPYRIEFFGDEVDSIRSFNIETQLSVDSYDNVEVIPNIQKRENIKSKKISLFEFLHKGIKIFFTDLELLKESLSGLNQKIDIKDIDNNFINIEKLEQGILENDFVEINSSKVKNYKTEIKVKSIPQPVFNKNFDLLKKNLKENNKKGIKNIIFFSDKKQKNRFETIFQDTDEEIKFSSEIFPINKGFVDLDNKMACYTDHQIFERYYKYKTKSNSFKSQALTIKEFTDLKKGDFVAHIDHGVGKFMDYIK